ncbi:MAG: hypothetical protein WBW04_16840 [Nitrolancea sp.]
MLRHMNNVGSRAEIVWSRSWGEMQHNAGLSGSALEMSLRDGRFLRLDGPRLALLNPDGTFESSHLLSEITECSNPKETREVFLRIWTNEEITLLASSISDAEKIVQWAANAPRLQRRADNQHAERIKEARIRLIGGGVTIAIGFGLLILLQLVHSPKSYLILPLGLIAFGGIGFVNGLIQYYRA